MDGLNEVYSAKIVYLERHTHLRREFQAAVAAQSQIVEWLGQSMMWLGSRFTAWGKALQNRQEPAHLQASS